MASHNPSSPPTYNQIYPVVATDEDYVVVQPVVVNDMVVGEPLSPLVDIHRAELPPEYENQTETTYSEGISAAREKMLLQAKYADKDSKHEVVKHFVQTTDTLYGISLKYKVPVADLRKANRLYDKDEVTVRTFIYIPNVSQSISPVPSTDDIKSQLIRQFCQNTNCKEAFEAKTYLELSDWVLDRAVESYHSDLNWELQQQGGPSRFRS